MLAALAHTAVLARPGPQQNACAAIDEARARYDVERGTARVGTAEAAHPDLSLRLRTERNQAVLSYLSKPDRRFSDWEVRVVQVESRALRYAASSVMAVDVLVSLQCRTPALFQVRALSTPELVAQFRGVHTGDTLLVSGFVLADMDPPAAGQPQPDARFSVQFTSVATPED